MPVDDFRDMFQARYEQGNVPWAVYDAHPHLKAWAEQMQLSGEGKKGLVVACGLGDDAEYLADLGFDVTAFDVVDSAIEQAKKRFPETTVDYHVADLFNTPDDWQQAFDFVVENRTIQSIPYEHYQKSINSIANFVAPAGRVIVLCHAREPQMPHGTLPWSLSTAELQDFEDAGLTQVSFEHLQGGRYFRVVYQR